MQKTYYLVGIKGVAMTALAGYLTDQNSRIFGSDTDEKFPTDDTLAGLHITPDSGFKPDSLINRNPDMVIYTGAHGGKENPQVLAAVKAGIPVLPHAEALGKLMDGYSQISVAGCHGKTTISAFLATLLVDGGLDPSYAVGCGWICPVGLPGHTGKGKWFIAEADEYVTDPGHDTTPRFMWQNPRIVLISNIAFDHPDAYRDLDHLFRVYQEFVLKVPKDGYVITNADDKLCQRLSFRAKGISVGFSRQADVRISETGQIARKSLFTLTDRDHETYQFSLAVPGFHNIHNAAFAITAARQAGMKYGQIRRSLRRFCGARRRFEKIGRYGGMDIYDDYAHHPDEISATLSAARLWYPKGRILAVFQPHTYSRTKALLHDFVRVFTDADTVLVTDIYASAREHDTLGITSEKLAAAIGSKHTDVHYCPGISEVKKFITSGTDKYQAAVFMGAGNIYTWSKIIAGSDK